MRKRNSNKNYSVKILKYFSTAKLSLIFLTILMICICVVEIINPIISANLLIKITEFNVNDAIKFSFLLIIVSLIKGLFNQCVNYIYLKQIKNKIILNIRKDMIKRIFDMKIVNFDIHTSGEFINRLKNDPEQISSILSIVQFSFFNLLADLFVLIYIMYINLFLGIIYIISVLAIYFYQKNVLNKIKKIQEESETISDKNASLLNEILHGIRDIKILNIGVKTRNMVMKSLTDTTNIETDKNIKSSKLYETVNLLQSITVFVVIFVGIILVNNNLISVTSLVVIYMHRTNIFDLILCYRSIKEYLNEYSIASKRIFELLDDSNFPIEKFGTKKIDKIEGKIEIKDLSFAYNKKTVLNNINIAISPNDTIGIVGASGSGKTTLLNLIDKNYNVENNKIYIDDIDINELSEDSIRNNIAFISQNPYIFNLTIKENLELMGNNVTKKEIVKACKIAQIHDYIMSLPNQYDTLLGEGGANLSGGQKQRLAIARALIKKSKIILFDEATSALDNVTQYELQKSLNNISEDRTILIVAHRLSTIKECNKIFVMENGKIVGEGTHSELLKNNECYKKLYKEENK